MKNKLNLSIVIPTFNDLNHLIVLLKKINNQLSQPNELIIIDSSTNLEIFQYLENKYDQLNIIYKSYYNFNKFKIGFPGLSRNIGAKIANNENILFLDTKTIPICNTWLKDKFTNFIESNSNFLIGKTIFQSNNFLQEIHYSSSYGNKIYDTVPGTFVKKKFIENNFFLENLRAGEDLEWKLRIKHSSSIPTESENHPLIYNDQNDNLSKLIVKYIVYSFHSARTDIQINTKHLYLSLILILSLLIIPRWNFLIGGWTTNPLYIPNITKIYFLSILLLMLFNLIINNFIFRRLYESYITKILKIITFIIITYSVINWNVVFTDLVEYSVFVIPHITKIYILTLLTLIIIYRGLYKPLLNSVKFKSLFPSKFLLIGLLGLLLDLVKMPGYIVGSLISLFSLNSNKKIK